MMQDLNTLYSNLNIPKRIISAISDQPDIFYRKKDQPKKKFGKNQLDEKGLVKYRKLCSPSHTLKLIQNQIHSLLQTIDVPHCFYGGIEGKNNIANALQHVENTFFLKIDLQDYFGRITAKKVHHTLLANGFSWEVARIITRLTTLANALPQGAPSSPVLANLVFVQTALQLEDLIKNEGITFTLFYDDLVFSSKRDFKVLVQPILQIIKGNKFLPHPKKIQYRKYTCEVTGLIIRNKKLKLIREMQREALISPRIRAYANFVERCWNNYKSKQIIDPA